MNVAMSCLHESRSIAARRMSIGSEGGRWGRTKVDHLDTVGFEDALPSHLFNGSVLVSCTIGGTAAGSRTSAERNMNVRMSRSLPSRSA
jgi:hypothetical protein